MSEILSSGVLTPDAPLSFDELYERYATDVLRVSYYYLKDRQKAEDVTQEVFVRLLTNRPELTPGHEKAWLFKVALNKCRDYWRGAWFRNTVLGHPAMEIFPAPDEIEGIAQSETLARAVADLPTEFREVVLLHYYQGFGVTEIAGILNIAEGTVSSRLSRARKRLEKLLEGGDPA